MTNPIGGVPPAKVPLPNGAGKGASTGKAAPASDSGTAKPTDKVDLTDAAETLQELEKSLGENAQISSEKVAAIKEALASGQYKIDPDLIAQKFLEVERALGKV
ncbi:MAG: flagellar biosynthesis anti-sigma factor FlgM [Pseudomonadota bacterium]